MSLDVTLYDENGDEVYMNNITHNLSRMARAAGVYEVLWRPDENGITYARQIVPVLTIGVRELATQKAKFAAYDSPNGWGTFTHFLHFCVDYLQACRDYPDATVRVSR